jgi:hypothetical protein
MRLDLIKGRPTQSYLNTWLCNVSGACQIFNLNHKNHKSTWKLHIKNPNMTRPKRTMWWVRCGPRILTRQLDMTRPEPYMTRPMIRPRWDRLFEEIHSIEASPHLRWLNVTQIPVSGGWRHIYYNRWISLFHHDGIVGTGVPVPQGTTQVLKTKLR